MKSSVLLTLVAWAFVVLLTIGVLNAFGFVFMGYTNDMTCTLFGPRSEITVDWWPLPDVVCIDSSLDVPVRHRDPIPILPTIAFAGFGLAVSNRWRWHAYANEQQNLST